MAYLNRKPSISHLAGKMEDGKLILFKYVGYTGTLEATTQSTSELVPLLPVCSPV